MELPNRSLGGTDSYAISTADIRLELHEWAQDKDPAELNKMAVWHTHPAGNIGPSKRDMHYRDPEVSYLVVALTEKGPIPTWF